MSPEEAASEIRRVVRSELSAVESALQLDDPDTAMSELADAVRKLKRIASDLD
jgi:hypothetical protein